MTQRIIWKACLGFFILEILIPVTYKMFCFFFHFAVISGWSVEAEFTIMQASSYRLGSKTKMELSGLRDWKPRNAFVLKSEEPAAHLPQILGWPRFGSVRLRFLHGTVRAVPVVGSDGSSLEGVLCMFQYCFDRKGRFRFRFRFLKNGSGGSGSASGFWKKRF